MTMPPLKKLGVEVYEVARNWQPMAAAFCWRYFSFIPA